MKTIELLANTLNVLTEYIATDENGGLSEGEQRWFDMATAKLEQEGYTQVTRHHVPVWTKDT